MQRTFPIFIQLKLRTSLLLFFLAGLFLVSCTVEKRHYRKGFYWDRNNNVHRELLPPVTKDSVESQIAVPDTIAASTDESKDESDLEPGYEEGLDQPEKSSTQKITEKGVKYVPAQVYEQEQLPDDPKPEGHDKTNPWITGLIIAGMILSMLFLLIDAFAIAGSAPYFFILGPLIGVLLFVLAMYLRKKYAERVAAGEKNDALRMSAHFHRFRVILFLFFIAALAMALGWLFAIAGGFLFSGLGVLGVILGGGGIVLVEGAGAVLLILGLIYLFHWRKDPTGEKPPRDKHPPKGG